MARIEFLCPITGQKQAYRFASGDRTPEQHYAVSCTKAECDEYENTHKRAPLLHRHPHQR